MGDPASKYRDKVDPHHKLMMDTILQAHHWIALHREGLAAFIEAERRAHSIGHITDPTLYRDMINSKSFAQQIKIARAAQAFIASVDEVIAAASVQADAGRQAATRGDGPSVGEEQPS